MTLPDLENLVAAGKLKREPPNQNEFDGLVKLGEAKFKDAQVASLSLESRFDLAYGASHAFALAGLRWHGYRSDLRYVVFQCLEHTLGVSRDVWRVLDKAHGARNAADYGGDQRDAQLRWAIKTFLPTMRDEVEKTALIQPGLYRLSIQEQATGKLLVEYVVDSTRRSASAWMADGITAVWSDTRPFLQQDTTTSLAP